MSLGSDMPVIGKIRETRKTKRPGMRPRVFHILTIVDDFVFVVRWYRTYKQYWEYQCIGYHEVEMFAKGGLYVLDAKAQKLFNTMKTNSE